MTEFKKYMYDDMKECNIEYLHITINLKPKAFIMVCEKVVDCLCRG